MRWRDLILEAVGLAGLIVAFVGLLFITWGIS